MNREEQLQRLIQIWGSQENIPEYELNKLNSEYPENQNNDMLNAMKIDEKNNKNSFDYDNQVKDEKQGRFAGTPFTTDQQEEFDRLGIVANPNDSPESIQQNLANRQSTIEQLGNAGKRLVADVFYGAIEQTADMFDIEDYINTENGVGNAISDWAREQKGEVAAANPIYTDPNRTLSDPAWWIENGESLASSIGSFAIAGGIGGLALKGLGLASEAALGGKSLLGAAAELTPAGSKVGNFLEGVQTNLNAVKNTLGISSDQIALAYMMNQSESIGIAADVYKNTYSDAKSKGFDEDYAKHLAGNAAAYSVDMNRANILLNITSAGMLVGKGRGTRELVSAMENNPNRTLLQRVLGTGKTPMLRAGKESLGKTLAGEAGQEYLEENINTYAQNKAEQYGKDVMSGVQGEQDVNGFSYAGLKPFGNIVGKGLTDLVGITSPELKGNFYRDELFTWQGLQDGLMGAIGAAGHVGVTRAFQKYGIDKFGLGTKTGLFGSKVEERHAENVYDASGNLVYKKGDLKYEQKERTAEENIPYVPGDVLRSDVSYEIELPDGTKATQQINAKEADGSNHILTEEEAAELNANKLFKYNKGETLKDEKGNAILEDITDESGKKVVAYKKDDKGRFIRESQYSRENRMIEDFNKQLERIAPNMMGVFESARMQENLMHATRHINDIVDLNLADRTRQTKENIDGKLEDIAKALIEVENGQQDWASEQGKSLLESKLNEFSETTPEGRQLRVSYEELAKIKDKISDSLLNEQSYNAFLSGGRDVLVNYYKHIASLTEEQAAAKNLAPDYKEKAKAAIEAINRNEKRFLQFKGLYQEDLARELYMNRSENDYLKARSETLAKEISARESKIKGLNIEDVMTGVEEDKANILSLADNKFGIESEELTKRFDELDDLIKNTGTFAPENIQGDELLVRLEKERQALLEEQNSTKSKLDILSKKRKEYVDNAEKVSSVKRLMASGLTEGEAIELQELYKEAQKIKNDIAENDRIFKQYKNTRKSNKESYAETMYKKQLARKNNYISSLVFKRRMDMIMQLQDTEKEFEIETTEGKETHTAKTKVTFNESSNENSTSSIIKTLGLEIANQLVLEYGAELDTKSEEEITDLVDLYITENIDSDTLNKPDLNVLENHKSKVLNTAVKHIVKNKTEDNLMRNLLEFVNSKGVSGKVVKVKEGEKNMYYFEPDLEKERAITKAEVTKYQSMKNRAGKNLYTIETEKVTIDDVETEVYKLIPTTDPQILKENRTAITQENIEKVDLLSPAQSFFYENIKNAQNYIADRSSRINTVITRFNRTTSELLKNKSDIEELLFNYSISDITAALDKFVNVQAKLKKNNLLSTKTLTRNLSIEGIEELEKIANNSSEEAIRESIEKDLQKDLQLIYSDLSQSRKQLNSFITEQEELEAAVSNIWENEQNPEEVFEKVQNRLFELSSLIEEYTELAGELQSKKDNLVRKIDTIKNSQTSSIEEINEEVKKLSILESAIANVNKLLDSLKNALLRLFDIEKVFEKKNANTNQLAIINKKLSKYGNVISQLPSQNKVKSEIKRIQDVVNKINSYSSSSRIVMLYGNHLNTYKKNAAKVIQLLEEAYPLYTEQKKHLKTLSEVKETNVEQVTENINKTISEYKDAEDTLNSMLMQKEELTFLSEYLDEYNKRKNEAAVLVKQIIKSKSISAANQQVKALQSLQEALKLEIDKANTTRKDLTVIRDLAKQSKKDLADLQKEINSKFSKKEELNKLFNFNKNHNVDMFSSSIDDLQIDEIQMYNELEKHLLDNRKKMNDNFNEIIDLVNLFLSGAPSETVFEKDLSKFKSDDIKDITALANYLTKITTELGVDFGNDVQAGAQLQEFIDKLVISINNLTTIHDNQKNIKEALEEITKERALITRLYNKLITAQKEQAQQEITNEANIAQEPQNKKEKDKAKKEQVAVEKTEEKIQQAALTNQETELKPVVKEEVVEDDIELISRPNTPFEKKLADSVIDRDEEVNKKDVLDFVSFANRLVSFEEKENGIIQDILNENEDPVINIKNKPALSLEATLRHIEEEYSENLDDFRVKFVTSTSENGKYKDLKLYQKATSSYLSFGEAESKSKREGPFAQEGIIGIVQKKNKKGEWENVYVDYTSDEEGNVSNIKISSSSNIQTSPVSKGESAMVFSTINSPYYAKNLNLKRLLLQLTNTAKLSELSGKEVTFYTTELENDHILNVDVKHTIKFPKDFDITDFNNVKDASGNILSAILIKAGQHKIWKDRQEILNKLHKSEEAFAVPSEIKGDNVLRKPNDYPYVGHEKSAYESIDDIDIVIPMSETEAISEQMSIGQIAVKANDSYKGDKVTDVANVRTLSNDEALTALLLLIGGNDPSLMTEATLVADQANLINDPNQKVEIDKAVNRRNLKDKFENKTSIPFLSSLIFNNDNTKNPDKKEKYDKFPMIFIGDVKGIKKIFTRITKNGDVAEWAESAINVEDVLKEFTSGTVSYGNIPADSNTGKLVKFIKQYKKHHVSKPLLSDNYYVHPEKITLDANNKLKLEYRVYANENQSSGYKVFLLKGDGKNQIPVLSTNLRSGYTKKAGRYLNYTLNGNTNQETTEKEEKKITVKEIAPEVTQEKPVTPTIVEKIEKDTVQVPFKPTDTKTLSSSLKIGETIVLKDVEIYSIDSSGAEKYYVNVGELHITKQEDEELQFTKISNPALSQYIDKPGANTLRFVNEPDTFLNKNEQSTDLYSIFLQKDVAKFLSNTLFYSNKDNREFILKFTSSFKEEPSALSKKVETVTPKVIEKVTPIVTEENSVIEQSDLEGKKADKERRRQELESSREILTLYDLTKPITEDSKEIISKIEEANKLRKEVKVKSEQAAKETNEEKRIALNSDADSLNEKAQILDKEVKASRDSVINNTPIKQAITSAKILGQKLLNKIKLAAKSNEWVSSMPISKEEFTKFEDAIKRLSVKNMGEVTSNSEVIPDILLIEEINAKYDAELKALKQQDAEVSNQSKIEDKKADIERRRQEELDNVGAKQKKATFLKLREVKTSEEQLNAINEIERNVAEGAVLTKEEQKEVQKIKDKLASEGYEVPKILNQRFHQGMKVIVTSSIPDENLAVGEEVITKVLTPQVNHNDKMVQTAQIEVTFGTKKGGLTREQWLEEQKKKETRTDKINAKYDAELAALNETQDKANFKSKEELIKIYDKDVVEKQVDEEIASLYEEEQGLLILADENENPLNKVEEDIEYEGLDDLVSGIDETNTPATTFVSTNKNLKEEETKDSFAFTKGEESYILQKNKEGKYILVDEETGNTEKTYSIELAEIKKELEKEGYSEVKYRMTPIKLKYNKEDIDKATKWIESVFGEYVKVKMLNIPVLIKNADNMTMGTFSNNLIQLFKGAEEGTTYHEAIHAVFALYLTRNEIKSILNELRQRPDYDQLIRQMKSLYKRSGITLTTLQAEEEVLAEEFKEWIMSNGRTSVTTKVAKSLWEKLWEVIKLLFQFKNPSDINPYKESKVIETLYNNIVKGKYRKPFNSSRLNNNKMYSIKTVAKDDQNNDVNLHTDLHNGILNSLQYSFFNGFVNQEQLERILELEGTSTELDSYYEKAISDVENRKNEIAEMKLGKVQKEKILSDLDKSIDILKRDDVKTYFINELKSKLSSYEFEFEVAEGDSTSRDGTVAEYTDSYKIDTKDLMPKVVRMMIYSLPKIKTDDNGKPISKKDENGNAIISNGFEQFEEEKDAFGNPVLSDSHKIISLLARKFSNSTVPTQEAFLSKLEEISKEENKKSEVGIYELNNLLSKLTGFYNKQKINLSNDYDALSANQILNKFVQQFTLFSPRHLITLIYGDGRITLTDANADKLESLVSNDFLRNYQVKLKEFNENKNGILKVNYDYVNALDKAVKSKKWSTAFNLLGLDMTLNSNETNTDKALQQQFATLKDKTGESKSLNAIFGIIIDKLNKMAELNEKNPNLNMWNIYSSSEEYSDLGIKGTLQLFIDAEANNSNKVVNNQFVSPDGETVYGIQRNTYMSLLVNEFNYYLNKAHSLFPGDYAKIQEYLKQYVPHMFHIYSKGSLILDRAIKNNSPIDVSVTSGLNVTGSGEAGEVTSQLSPGDRLIQSIHNTLNGYNSFFRAADRQVENVFSQKHNGQNLIYPFESRSAKELNNIFMNYLVDEFNMIVQYKKVNLAHQKDKFLNAEYKKGDVNFGTRGHHYRLMDGILSNETKEHIINNYLTVNDNKKDEKIPEIKQANSSYIDEYDTFEKIESAFKNDAKLKDLLEKSLKNYFANLLNGVGNSKSTYNGMLEALKANGILDYSPLEIVTKYSENSSGKKEKVTDYKIKSVFAGISQELYDKYKSKAINDQPINVAKEIITHYLENQIISFIEQTKLLLGDPATFKNEDDWFKRMSGANGTKDISVYDEVKGEELINSRSNSYVRLVDATGNIVLNENGFAVGIKADERKLLVDVMKESDTTAKKQMLQNIMDKLNVSGLSTATNNFIFGYGFRLDGKKENTKIRTIIFNDVNVQSKYAVDTVEVNKIEVATLNGKTQIVYKDKEGNTIDNKNISELRKAFVNGLVSDGETNSDALLRKSDIYLDPFNKMTEGDAQGYVSLDEYRMIKIRAAQWSPRHQRAWNKAILGLELSASELQYFQPLKTQYYGPVADYVQTDSAKDSSYVVGFYKHSLTPLIPSVVKNKQLESLMHYMTDNQIGIAQFESATKIGIKMNDNLKGNNLYNKEGIINLYETKPNTQEIYYKYFGVQVYIADKVKDKVTAGTQLRKLILSNLYSFGDLNLGIFSGIDIEGEKIEKRIDRLTNDYKNLQAELVEKPFDKLISEIGLEGVVDQSDNLVGYRIKNKEMFMNIIKEEAIDRNSSKNVIEAIEYLNKQIEGRATRGIFTEEALSSRKIENILSAIVNSRVIREKRHGGGKPQVASTGFEKKVYKVTDEGKVVNKEGNELSSVSGRDAKSNNFLRFYAMNKTNTKILPAEAMIALPKEWINVVNTKYGGLDSFNQIVKQFNDKFYKFEENRKSAKTTWESKLSENASYTTTIDGVKTTYTVNEQVFNKLVQTMGFRIPTQGLSSIDCFRVAEFLPAEYADAFVVPSEIVAKSGSDFDIDKMNTYFYNIGIDNNDFTISKDNRISDESEMKNRYIKFINEFIKGFNFTNETIEKLKSNKTELQKQIINDFTQEESNQLKQVYDSVKQYENIYVDTYSQILTVVNNMELVSPEIGRSLRKVLIYEKNNKSLNSYDNLIIKLFGLMSVLENSLNIINESEEVINNKEAIVNQITNDLSKLDEIVNKQSPDLESLVDAKKQINTLKIALKNNKNLAKKSLKDNIDYNKIVEDIQLEVAKEKGNLIKEATLDNRFTYANFVKQPFEKQLTKESLQNEIFDTQLDILALPNNMRAMLAPIGDAEFNDSEIGVVIDARFLESNSEQLRSLYVKRMEVYNKLKNENPDITEDELTLKLATELLPVYQEKKKEWSKRQSKKSSSFTEVLNPVTNLEKFIFFLSGKGGVGQTAVHITSHTLTQQSNMMLAKPITLTPNGQVNNYAGSWLFDCNFMVKEGDKYRALKGHVKNYKFNTQANAWELKEGNNVIDSLNAKEDVNVYVSFGGYLGKDGKPITEVLSAFLTAYVDIAKDPYIFDLNAGNAVANTIMMLVRAGVPLRTITRFIKQPVIVKYFENQRNNESQFKKAKEMELEKKEIIVKTLNNYSDLKSKFQSSNSFYITDHEFIKMSDLEKKAFAKAMFESVVDDKDFNMYNHNSFMYYMNTGLDESLAREMATKNIKEEATKALNDKNYLEAFDLLVKLRNKITSSLLSKKYSFISTGNENLDNEWDELAETTDELDYFNTSSPEPVLKTAADYYSKADLFTEETLAKFMYIGNIPNVETLSDEKLHTYGLLKSEVNQYFESIPMILDVMLDLQRHSKYFQESIRSMSADTRGVRSTITENGDDVRMIEKVKNSKRFVNFDNILTNSVVAPFTKIKIKTYNMFAEMSLAESEPIFKERLSLLTKDLRRKGKDMSETVKNNFVMFLMHTDFGDGKYINNESVYKKLLSNELPLYFVKKDGETVAASFPRYMQELKTISKMRNLEQKREALKELSEINVGVKRSVKHLLKLLNNRFFQMLNPVISNAPLSYANFIMRTKDSERSVLFDSLNIVRKKLTKIEEKEIEESVEDFKDIADYLFGTKGNNIYNNLLNVLFATTGNLNTSTSYGQYMPFTIAMDMTTKQINNYLKLSSEEKTKLLNAFEDQFYRLYHNVNTNAKTYNRISSNSKIRQPRGNVITRELEDIKDIVTDEKDVANYKVKPSVFYLTRTDSNRNIIARLSNGSTISTAYSNIPLIGKKDKFFGYYYSIDNNNDTNTFSDINDDANAIPFPESTYDDTSIQEDAQASLNLPEGINCFVNVLQESQIQAITELSRNITLNKQVGTVSELPKQWLTNLLGKLTEKDLSEYDNGVIKVLNRNVENNVSGVIIPLTDVILNNNNQLTTIEKGSYLIGDNLKLRNASLVINLTKNENKVYIEKPYPGVENIPDTGLTIEQANKFIDLLQPQILNQAYVENKAKTANRMFSFGLRWAKNVPNIGEKSIQGQSQIQRPDRVPISSVSSYDGYGYYLKDQNNKPLPSIKELKPIIDFVESMLGIDMSDYDSVLGNIYENGSFIHQHRDITESISAKNYPIIVLNLGAEGGLLYHTEYSDETKVNPNKNTYSVFEVDTTKHKYLPIKNGGIYAFGVDGVNRFTFNHRVQEGSQNTPTKNLIVPEWDSKGNLIGKKVLSNYRITLTFRRAQDLNDLIPTAPSRIKNENKVNNLEPNDFVNHSGGASGSDTYWDVIGREFGVINHNHYREPLNYIDSKGLAGKGSLTLDSKVLTQNGVKPVYITQEEYNEGFAKASKAFQMMYKDSGTKSVRNAYIIRNWMQVKNADAVYAIGTIKQPGENASDKTGETRIAAIPIVKGGTGYAVQMAINEGKPVYVFDGTKEGWYKYDYAVKNFIPTETPTLTKNFAGVGTREIPQNAIQAIKDVYQKTFGNTTNEETTTEEYTSEPEEVFEDITNIYSEISPDKKMAMNGFDPQRTGRNPLQWMPNSAKFRSELNGNTLIDLIKQGNRTSSTRSLEERKKIEDLVGGVDSEGNPLGNPYIWATDEYNKENESVIVKITKIHQKSNKERGISADYWSEREGWDASYLLAKPQLLDNKHYHVDFEYVPNLKEPINNEPEIMKEIVVPQGSSETNAVLFETATHKYLMNDEQVNAIKQLEKFVLEKTVLRKSRRETDTYQDIVGGQQKYLNTSIKSIKINDGAKPIPSVIFKNAIGLQGKAGTGKTSIVKKLLPFLRENDLKYVFVSPTHEASAPLMESLGLDPELKSDIVKTYASLVNRKVGASKLEKNGIPEENTDLYLEREDIRLNNIQKGFGAPICRYDVIIFDESSMYGQNIYDLALRIESELKTFHNRVRVPSFIFMGDYRQIVEVNTNRPDNDNSRDHVSESILMNPAKRVVLNEVMRTKNEDLYQIFDSVANQIDLVDKNQNDESALSLDNFNEHLKTTKDILAVPRDKSFELINYYGDQLRIAKTPYDIIMVRYNNERYPSTIRATDLIRKSYLKERYKENEFVEGDYLMFSAIGEPWLTNEQTYLRNGNRVKYVGKTQNPYVLKDYIENTLGENFLPYLTIKDPNTTVTVNTVRFIGRSGEERSINLLQQGKLKTYYDADTKTQVYDFGENNFLKIPYSIYKDNEDFFKKMATTEKDVFRFGYLVSGQKVQGSTYKEVIVDVNNIKESIKNQSFAHMMSVLYTAITRTSDKLVLIDSEFLIGDEYDFEKYIPYQKEKMLQDELKRLTPNTESTELEECNS